MLGKRWIICKARHWTKPSNLAWRNKTYPWAGRGREFVKAVSHSLEIIAIRGADSEGASDVNQRPLIPDKGT